ncbi:unnamed protein product [Paramecium sonneborni]|uniref:F-box domain-containing protein n=1 Tax=Paramecium sonneborni TaxID=65129 RepID=A0A8S1RNI9_9CILI|nr:unnamed protein product [Paramecium sonneborni]
MGIFITLSRRNLYQFFCLCLFFFKQISLNILSEIIICFIIKINYYCYRQAFKRITVITQQESRPKLNSFKLISQYQHYQLVIRRSKYLNINLESASQTQNLLHKVRPEVFNQILEFIDLKDFLNFRLVSQRGNSIVIYLIPYRIPLIQQQLSFRKSKIKEYKQNNLLDESIQDLLQRKQRADFGLNSLCKQDISEIKRMAHPHVIIEKVMTMVCVLLDQKFKGENSNWSACQKILDDIQFLDYLRHLDVDFITDKQLKFLQNNIHSLSIEKFKGYHMLADHFFNLYQQLQKLESPNITKQKKRQNYQRNYLKQKKKLQIFFKKK